MQPGLPLSAQSSNFSPSRFRSHLTLGLCVLLHAFTHAYGVLLVPLYLMMKAELHLPGVKSAALIVTLYGVVYNFASYGAGLLADRLDRRLLLGVGLLGNAAAIGGMGICHDYGVILLLGVFAGLFGTLFHPAANALVCAHYPKNPGLAIGLLGVGSGLGFFAGPQYSGWRAQQSGQWQAPCRDAGLAGLILGACFLAIAAEAGHRRSAAPRLSRPLFRTLIGLALVLGWRDFAGVATVTLASIYLQRASGKTVAEAGFIVGGMMLLAVGANPLAAYLSHGRRRLWSLSAVCLTGGLILTTTPLWPAAWALIPLCAFETLQLASYAISDAATLERVAPSVRGRVVGVYLTIAGTLGALSPWCMGYWTDCLGQQAQRQSGYAGPFLALGIMMWVAALSPLLIRRMGVPLGIQPITVAEEIAPRTMGGVV